MMKLLFFRSFFLRHGEQGRKGRATDAGDRPDKIELDAVDSVQKFARPRSTVLPGVAPKPKACSVKVSGLVKCLGIRGINLFEGTHKSFTNFDISNL